MGDSKLTGVAGDDLYFPVNPGDETALSVVEAQPHDDGPGRGALYFPVNSSDESNPPGEWLGSSLPRLAAADASSRSADGLLREIAAVA